MRSIIRMPKALFPPRGRMRMAVPSAALRFIPRVRFADIFEAYTAVAPFHIGRFFAQMGGTYVLQAVCLRPALSAFDGGVVGKALDEVFLPLCLESAHMHAVRFGGTAHGFLLHLSV